MFQSLTNLANFKYQTYKFYNPFTAYILLRLYLRNYLKKHILVKKNAFHFYNFRFVIGRM